MFNSLNKYEESRWFLKWLSLRHYNKKLSFENGQLKAELAHLEYVIEDYKKQEVTRLKRNFAKVRRLERKQQRENKK